MSELTDIFNILKNRFPGYEKRPQQIAMAAEVLACLRNKERLLAEAGTGVGKSFAYLIPAVLSNEKTVVSTASIALQDQLVKRDLVFLQEALPRGFSFAILKGKNNYLCLKREREFVELGEPYRRFAEWASVTETGDRDELPFIPDFWDRVCGDPDDCGVARCPYYSRCFYYRHYRELRKKDILVVNHHLLVFDLLSDFNLLPFHGQLIIDEAHQIENVISHVLGSVLNHSRVVWLLYRLRGMKIAVDHLFEPVDMFFKRKDLRPGIFPSIPDDIREGLADLRRQLALDRIVRRLNASREPSPDSGFRDKAETTAAYARSLDGVIEDFMEQGDNDKVYYLSVNDNRLELRSSLVEARRAFADLAAAYDSVVMTSATLTAAGSFDFLKQRLGIADNGRRRAGAGEPGSGERGLPFREMVAGSPFDFRRQALLYLEKELPPPVKDNEDAFLHRGLRVIERLLAASRGRALVLFTSYRHLNFASRHINIDYPFRSQGEMPPAGLIRWFKETPGSVLLATATFWQGVDIKGEDLSMVIIVKMPFGSPGDPVYDERCRRLGNRWFAGLALPSAILQLKQGFGRLIRGVDDYGVVAVLDTRLVTSSYGGTVISSLPEMEIVHSVEDVRRFFDGRRGGDEPNSADKGYNRNV